ncbi:MAG: hypothetical protein WGN25_19090 [Candidatus Electrothrix sp. GW3-4]|uniref:hypothetical protein n=1 Tax=Candidatus Electrothrix sp. GW3-4 TaxID=3126740 RepID=UPI0030CC693A
MCSQCAIIFNKIMNSKGYTSVILRLNGHVVNEVAIDGRLFVYDPNFNINFNKQLHELVDNPNFLYTTYIQHGATEKQAAAFVQAFSTQADNTRIRFADKYAAAGTRQDLIEPASFYLIWLIPALFILLGLKLLWYHTPDRPDRA